LSRVLTPRWFAAAALALCAALPVDALAQVATTPPAVEEPHPFKHILQNLGRDLKGMASFDTLVILSAGGAASLIAVESDNSAHQWSLDRPVPAWAPVGRVAGDGWTQGALAAGTFAAGSLTKHKLATHVGSDLIRAQVLNMVTTRVVKIVVDRTRPSGGGHSFPSGHSSATFTTAAVVHRHFGWKAGIPAYAVAGFVGLSRVADRSHWVSDTVFGAAMGVAAAWSVTRGHDNATWTVTAVPAPGGGTIVVRW
jgi:membrane-associated phospholipid phosphatase